MFNVLVPQNLVQKFPFSISCLDQFQKKLFIGLDDGSLLDYEIVEEPFTISLLQIHKKAIISGLKQLVILPISRSLALLSKDGSVFLADYTSSAIKAIHLPRIKGANVLARSSFNSLTVDSLAIGIKRGLYIYTISASEAMESPFIKLPATPIDLQFVSANKILVATKIGILLVDTIGQSHRNIFSVKSNGGLFGSSKSSYLVAVRKHDSMLERESCNSTQTSTQPNLHNNDTIFYCVYEADFYQVSLQSDSSIMSFSFSGIPSKIAVDDYYAIGLIEKEESVIEIRSLKTGSNLQEFMLSGATWMNFQELAFVCSESNVWRLLPLDFDEQIDELLTNNRFQDAEAFLNELEFSTEDEKRNNLVKVKGCFAQHLFIVEKKYRQAINVLEDLNASPLDIIELYPDFSELDLNIDAINITALQELALYLARERSKLLKYKKVLNDKIYESNHGITSFKSFTNLDQLESSLEDSRMLLEFVETNLMHIYLMIDSPLLGPLVRVNNSCNQIRTVAILTKYKKHDELVDFYHARGYHKHALDFLYSIRENNDFKKIIHYLQHLDMNSNLNVIFEYAKEPLMSDPSALSIFIENPREVKGTNRAEIAKFLESISEEKCQVYLEYLVLKNHDTDPEINSKLFQIYLNRATLSEKDKLKFSNFVFKNQYFSSQKVLEMIPADAFLEEQTHILSRLHRHKDALDIFIKKMKSLELAENYCARHYRHNNRKSNYLYSCLYELFSDSCHPNDSQKESFVLKYGFRMINSQKAMLELSPLSTISQIQVYLDNHTKVQQSRSNLFLCKEELLSVFKLSKRFQLFQLVNKKIEIDADSMCRICLKRLSSTLCTFFPDGRMAHTYCATRISAV